MKENIKQYYGFNPEDAIWLCNLNTPPNTLLIRTPSEEIIEISPINPKTGENNPYGIPNYPKAIEYCKAHPGSYIMHLDSPDFKQSPNLILEQSLETLKNELDRLKALQQTKQNHKKPPNIPWQKWLYLIESGLANKWPARIKYLEQQIDQLEKQIPSEAKNPDDF